jgi:beta-galactosidase
VLIDKRKTTGPPSKIVLRPDRQRIAANGEDVSVIVTEVVDAQGRIVPTAWNGIRFKASGPGRIIGVGNGDPSSHESDKGDTRSAFNGLCVAIVQASKEPGEIRVEALAGDLQSGAAVIETARAELRPAID